MALRANRPIEGFTILSALESEYGYHTATPDEIAIYLDRNRELFAPLIQASAAIADFFPTRKRVELSLSADDESGDAIRDGVLFVTVDLPNLAIENHLELLNAFLSRWYVLAARDSLSARRLVFDLR